MIAALWRRRRSTKAAKGLLRHARHVRRMREDILPAAALDRLQQAETGCRDAIRAGSPERMDQACGALASAMDDAVPRHSHPGLRENLEVLLVAVAVAWGFRTYFVQPFKIPTGSMQPSLYGIHSRTVDQPSARDRLPLAPLAWMVWGESYREVRIGPSLWDRFPLKIAKWAVTRQWYSDFSGRAPLTGPFQADINSPSVVIYYAGPNRYDVPKDAWQRGEVLVAPGQYVQNGDLLWRGRVTSGDHLFVNRVAWNFSRPRRGQVIVFSTDGISDLPPKTHYIKRLVGMPGEQFSIRPPEIFADGQPITDSPGILRLARREPGYEYGYQLAPRSDGTPTRPLLSSVEDRFRIPADGFFVLGDNTGNSRDSRYWGAVPRSNLVGPAFLVYWPFSSRWGFAK